SWGSTYLVTSEFLPEGLPFTAAVIRCLPAGLVLIVLSHLLSKASASNVDSSSDIPCRRLFPAKAQWPRLLLLSALNIGCFQAMLFVAAYRLPGGLAAVIGAVQPLILLLMIWALQKQPPGKVAFTACITAVIGMALLILSPTEGEVSGKQVSWDLIGIGAASLGALSMALGVYYSRYGQRSNQNNQETATSTELPLIALTG
ncbi:EamA family transporter, partial [Oceanospirillum sp. HFRX-1_2]